MFEEPTEPAARPQVATITTRDSTAVVIADRYQVVRTLGQGGMGIVYEAWDRRMTRNIALKLIRPDDGSETGGAAARLMREAQAMAALEHENVVSAFDVGTWNHQVYLAMQLVQGTTLRCWMETPRSSAEKLAVLIGAGRGLVAAHEQRIVHRDFKPDNVLVDKRGVARVTDFGIATQLDRTDVAGTGSIDPLGHTQLTQSGAIIGTPVYMAPEQALGSTVTAKADQYSFCTTAWELFAGHRPFAGRSVTEVLANKLAGELVPTSTSGWPAGLESILRRGLASEPAARYETLEDLLVELQRVSTEPVARVRSRLPGRVAFGLVTVGGLASAGLITWSIKGSAPASVHIAQSVSPPDAAVPLPDASKPLPDTATLPTSPPSPQVSVATPPAPVRSHHTARRKPQVAAPPPAAPPPAASPPASRSDVERKQFETALDAADAARGQRQLLIADIPAYADLRDQARTAAERGDYAAASELATRARTAVVEERIDAPFIEAKTRRLSEVAARVQPDPERTKQLQAHLAAVTSAAASDQYARANEHLTAVGKLLGLQ